MVSHVRCWQEDKYEILVLKVITKKTKNVGSENELAVYAKEQDLLTHINNLVSEAFPIEPMLNVVNKFWVYLFHSGY